MIFDDGYGTVTGNDNPTVLKIRKPYKLDRDNTMFQQPIGVPPTYNHYKLLVIIGVVLFAILAIGHIQL
jgi:hypothetical protein